MSTLDELAARHCRPLKGPEHKLSADAVTARLAALPDWTLIEDGAAISRTFKFDDYHRTMAFVNATAWISHREDHHPELRVGYNECRVAYHTHAIKGLSENDFICAAKIEAVA